MALPEYMKTTHRTTWARQDIDSQASTLRNSLRTESKFSLGIGSLSFEYTLYKFKCGKTFENGPFGDKRICA